MNITQIGHDIHLLCARASSFPEGVLAAFRQIEQSDPAFCKRDFYGLSRGNARGGIDYWAAVEELTSGEVEKHRLEEKVIRKGAYAAIEIKDFRKDIPAIEAAFKKLLQHPELDPATFCVEKYINGTVICMVRLRGKLKTTNLNP